MHYWLRGNGRPCFPGSTSSTEFVYVINLHKTSKINGNITQIQNSRNASLVVAAVVFGSGRHSSRECGQRRLLKKRMQNLSQSSVAKDEDNVNSATSFVCFNPRLRQRQGLERRNERK